MENLTEEGVAQLAEQQGAEGPCSACAVYASPGWESFPGTVSEAGLKCVGALWLADPGDEPTLEEFRPVGVDQWSEQAPIALSYHPYNRCQIWTCRTCGYPFLRYTEYGGYYEDQRIRELNPALVLVGHQLS